MKWGGHAVCRDTRHSHNAPIITCEKGHLWEQALRSLKEHAWSLIQDTTRSSLQPDVISYSAAISACEKGQQWEQVLRPS